MLLEPSLNINQELDMGHRKLKSSKMFFYMCFVLLLVATCNGASTGVTTITQSSSVCNKKNAFYKVEGSCDAYVECINYVATDLMCPNGLHFDVNAVWPNYPCVYPTEVTCIGRGSMQSAEPTAECPHQYGFFPSSGNDPRNCGQFQMCIAGKAIKMSCPTGLAYNPATSRCDWPEQVPSCNIGDFLGFECPTSNGGEFINYMYEGNCNFFYSCRNGYPRLLSCSPGMAFDPESRRCVDFDLVQCANIA